jgi:hypothetical protein
MTWLKESQIIVKEMLNSENCSNIILSESKPRVFKKIKDVVTKSENYDENIKTWGIITATNPMGYSYSTEENNKRNQELKKYLIDSHYLYWNIKRRFGNNDEDSLFIPNVSEEDMKYFASIFGQESFIFGFMYRTEDGALMCEMTYWEVQIDEEEKEKYENPNYRGKKDKNGNLIPLDYEVPEGGYEYDIETKEGSEDGFSFVSNHGKKFKFVIPFEYFSQTVKEANEYLSDLFKTKDKTLVESRLLKTTIESKKFSASGKWRWRGFLYSKH